MVDLRNEARSSAAEIVFAFEELVQHLVVVFGDGLDQLRRGRLRPSSAVRREFRRSSYSAPMVSSCQTIAFISIRSTTPLNLSSCADGNLNRDGLGIEALADGIDGMLEIGTHLVNLVDEANSRDAVLIGLTPDFFRLRLHAVRPRQTPPPRHRARAASAPLRR